MGKECGGVGKRWRGGGICRRMRGRRRGTMGRRRGTVALGIPAETAGGAAKEGRRKRKRDFLFRKPK